MYQSRIATAVLSLVCLLVLSGGAYAQVGYTCLKPVAITDKWIEMGSPPWDPTDTFDPATDFYLPEVGWDPAVDHGQPLQISQYTGGLVSSRAMLPVQIGDSAGSDAFRNALAGCSEWRYGPGDSLPVLASLLRGPLTQGLEDLIAKDPNAFWDTAANEVFSPIAGQSPRIIALPVFSPAAFGQATATGAPQEIVRIVGFFVTGINNGVVSGHLVATSQLTMDPVIARIDEFAQLSAQITGPGSPISGLTLEFLVDGEVVGSAQTDGTGTARPGTTTFNVGLRDPGEYPGALSVRIQDPRAFLKAEEAFADLTVLRKAPFITWPQPAAITYGTPLGPQQLNAGSDVEGTFVYTPGAGAILPVNEHEGVPITVRFIPVDSELYEESTATVYLNVGFAPLVLTIQDANKLYLDAIPPLSFTATGFVNGDTVSVLTGTDTLRAEATASTLPGNYRIIFDWVAAENYFITLKLGTLTVLPRPTVTILQPVTPSPSTYGEPVTVTATVASGGVSPAGTVTLQDFDRVLGVAPISNGQATFSLSGVDAGPHSLSVVYGPGPGFVGSFSAAQSHTILKANTTTTLTSSLPSSRSGQVVTFTARVSPVAPGAGNPSGSVEFLRGSVVFATVPLSDGTAILSTSSLPVGKHSVQARYAATLNHNASTSNVVQQSVKGGGK